MSDKFLRIVDDGTGPVALFEREQKGAGERVFAFRRDLPRARGPCGNVRCLIRPKRSGRSQASTARSKRPHVKAESG